MNILPGTFVDLKAARGFRSIGGLEFELPRQDLQQSQAYQIGQTVDWGVRSESIKIVEDSTPDQKTFDATVVIVEPHGATTEVIVEVLGHQLHMTLPEPHRPQRGDQIRIKFDLKHLHLFEASTGRAL